VDKYRINKIFITSELNPEKIYPKDKSKRLLTRMIIYHIDDLNKSHNPKSLFDF